MTEEVYRIRAKCHNCGYEAEFEILKGNRFLDHKPLCPNCGCDDLHKVLIY